MREDDEQRVKKKKRRMGRKKRKVIESLTTEIEATKQELNRSATVIEELKEKMVQAKEHDDKFHREAAAREAFLSKNLEIAQAAGHRLADEVEELKRRIDTTVEKRRATREADQDLEKVEADNSRFPANAQQLGHEISGAIAEAVKLMDGRIQQFMRDEVSTMSSGQVSTMCDVNKKMFALFNQMSYHCHGLEQAVKKLPANAEQPGYEISVHDEDSATGGVDQRQMQEQQLHIQLASAFPPEPAPAWAESLADALRNPVSPPGPPPAHARAKARVSSADFWRAKP